MKKWTYPVLLIFTLMTIGFCSGQTQGDKGENNMKNGSRVRLITLDPGHFHAALVQKEMFPGIDSVVYVYSPGGPELKAHLDLIKQYNERKEKPAHWDEKVYSGEDYLGKMIRSKKGNVVIIAGNNRKKTEYIKRAIDAGMNVLGDKPMAITYKDFNLLQQAFEDAERKKVLLYDIMTERHEITNTMQKTLAHMPEIFGELEKGSSEDPAVFMESVHFFYKYVSGKALVRPDWFFDPLQQGDAMVDVGTHLIDLVQWECFPGQIIDYKKDITITSSSTWTTPLSLAQFSAITNKSSFPGFLIPYVKEDSILQTHANGEINYLLKNTHVKIIARWEFKAPEGSGDTYYSRLKGTKATLEIKQGIEEAFQPTLYIIPSGGEADKEYASALENAVKKLNTDYPGMAIEKKADKWKLIIPQSYKIGHEAHFAQVMKNYLIFLKENKLPDWEVPNMIAKYYTATKALEMAGKAPAIIH